MTPQHAVRKLERVAYHEAGHAVAACLFSIPLRAVTVAPGPRESSGGRVLGSIELAMQSPPDWANPWLHQAALYLGRTEKAVYALKARAMLPCVQTDGRIMFDIQDLDCWIEQNKR
jgi:hypothetical protein